MTPINSDLNQKQKKMIKRLSNPLFVFFMLLFQLPSACMCGLRVISINKNNCQTSVPLNYLNKNPFRSIYFAVQSMAAEFSTAALALIAMSKYSNSFAFLVINLKVDFIKKATQRVYFTCEDGHIFEKAIDSCIKEGIPKEVTAKATGKMTDGTIVSVFYITWSFKSRN